MSRYNRFFLPMLILSFLIFWSCANQDPGTQKGTGLSGETMGTTYSVKFAEAVDVGSFKSQIDSILVEINQQLSTYIPDSDISKFNAGQEGVLIPHKGPQHFLRVFTAAKKIYEQTNGNFNPTVMPLVNYWGFGYTGKNPVTQVDSMKVDSLKDLTGFGKVDLKMEMEITADSRTEYQNYLKSDRRIQLDFSAIAKGYGVDILADFLEVKGINDYMVEIGGEVRAKGMNSRKSVWTAGINTPDPEAETQDIHNAITLNNKSLATSGNYRNFYEVDGIKYAHTIDPDSGFPARNTLLSASVVAEDCMSADAFATAFMVMGLDRSYAFSQNDDSIEAYFIYGDSSGEMQVKYTSGFEKILLMKNN